MRRPFLLIVAVLLGLASLPTVTAARATPHGPTVAYLPLLSNGSNTQPAPGLPFDPAATFTGDGIPYDYSGTGACTLEPVPAGTLTAAINQPDYHGSLLCGAYLDVTGPQGNVRILVNNLCPECAHGDLDFEMAAFQAISPLSAGRVPISWRLVSPELSGPITYRYQGSNPWYIKVQVLNHRNPVYRMEIQTASGFVPMSRTEDNFFLYSPPPASPVNAITLRVTDIYSHTLTDSNIPVSSSDTEVFTGTSQFPAP